ncbi:MAG TPA: TOPRIM nucleotidyl transferase/hydrolase domain-containing protein [Longimicrobiaceae bacterium]|nr:TOPRIM nucleotidyl transferase/hydrolase domain-containing protein [Longimicrobiaceae bacterium]
MFISTHSGDVLRGMLDAGGGSLRIIRLHRVDEINVARELSPIELQEFWSDPLLRYSNILDGIFHEKVILCESDSDNRFYAAVLDAVIEGKGKNAVRPDIMFTHCGGKARLPTAIAALRRLAVPVIAVADFDVLSEVHPLSAIITALGGDWAALQADWRQVKNSIDAKRPELATADVRREIEPILAGAAEPVFPENARRAVLAVLARSSPWSLAKQTGKAFVPNGNPSQAVERLMKGLRAIGLFVVDVGELEQFVKTVPGHGPKWVNELLTTKDLADGELQPAREFVTAMADWKRQGSGGHH